MVTTKDFVKRRKTELEGQNPQSNWVYGGKGWTDTFNSLFFIHAAFNVKAEKRVIEFKAKQVIKSTNMS